MRTPVSRLAGRASCVSPASRWSSSIQGLQYWMGGGGCRRGRRRDDAALRDLLVVHGLRPGFVMVAGRRLRRIHRTRVFHVLRAEAAVRAAARARSRRRSAIRPTRARRSSTVSPIRRKLLTGGARRGHLHGHRAVGHLSAALCACRCRQRRGRTPAGCRRAILDAEMAESLPIGDGQRRSSSASPNRLRRTARRGSMPWWRIRHPNSLEQI